MSLLWHRPPGSCSVDRVVIDWPSGRTEELKNVLSGRAYECVEGKEIALTAS